MIVELLNKTHGMLNQCTGEDNIDLLFLFYKSYIHDESIFLSPMFGNISGYDFQFHGVFYMRFDGICFMFKT